MTTVNKKIAMLIEDQMSSVICLWQCQENERVTARCCSCQV